MKKDDYINLISDKSDCYGSYLLELMDRYDAANLQQITLEQAKKFYAGLCRKEKADMSYRNSEGYPDPTAGGAISSAAKEEQDIDKLNHKVIQSFRLLVDLAGFEIVGRVTLKHKKSGRIFK